MWNINVRVQYDFPRKLIIWKGGIIGFPAHFWRHAHVWKSAEGLKNGSPDVSNPPRWPVYRDANERIRALVTDYQQNINIINFLWGISYNFAPWERSSYSGWFGHFLYLQVIDDFVFYRQFYFNKLQIVKGETKEVDIHLNIYFEKQKQEIL